MKHTGPRSISIMIGPALSDDTLPRFAGKPLNQGRANCFRCGAKVSGIPPRQQRPDVGRKRLDDTVRVNAVLFKGHRQIEQVPAFFALVERTQLCSQKLIELVSRYFARPIIPA
jgi:hypothetical protein